MVVVFLFLSVIIIAFLLMLCLLLLKIEKTANLTTLIAEKFITNLYGRK